MKAITGTLESFKSERPSDILAPQLDRSPEDPVVWPPPVPAEHRCLCNHVFVQRLQHTFLNVVSSTSFVMSYTFGSMSVSEHPSLSTEGGPINELTKK